MPKRDRKEIYAAVLQALIHEGGITGPGAVRLTRVQIKANVPFDRLKEYLEELRAKGMVEPETWTPTQRGLEYLDEFRRFQQLLDRFGFGPGG